MAGQYRFKDINGNVVAQISASAQGAITFSGSAVDFSNASTITLGGVQLAGTASNALLLDGFDSTAFVFTSSFNTISQSISSQLNTLQTTSGSNIGRLNNLESKSSSVDISISSINTVTESVLSRTSNLESKSASVDISISNINSVTASNLARLSNLEIKSSSVDISITNINSVTASNIARLSNLETKSASVDISVSSINTFTSSNGNASLNNLTGSLATTGSNTFFGTQTYSGSVYIANDLIVQGSSSIQYISASSVSIGTNIVQLNTANPSVRFAGLTIIDSGSIGGSGSFLYDSVHDEFVFVHRGNGTNVTSSHFVLGPETYDSLGNETYLTTNILTKGTGKEHLVDSCIFDNGTTTCIKNNLVATGTISGTTIYGSTSVCSAVGKFTNCIDVGGGTFGDNVLINNVNLLSSLTIKSSCSTTGLQLYLYGLNATLSNQDNGNLVFQTNGTDRLTISCTGRVGIGSTPDYGTLSIFCTDNTIISSTQWGTSAANNLVMAVYNGSQCVGSAAGLRLITRNSGASIWNIYNISTGAATGDLVFGNGTGGCGTEKMRITNGGNVGINQTSTYSVFNFTGTDCGWGEGMVMNPAPNGYSAIHFRLEGRTGSCVTCTWQLGKETSSSGFGELLSINKQGLTGGTTYRVDASQQWKTNGDSIFGFNVGIKNTSPQGALHIGSALESSGDAAAINLKQTGTNETTGIYLERSGERRGYAIYVGGSLDSLVFQRNNTGTKSDVMTLTRDGYVAIGNANPVSRLTINNAVVGATLPYINSTSLSYNSEGISVAGSNTANANVGNGLTLYNNVASVGAYSPVIAFSSMTSGGAYNATYAFISGVYRGAGGDANWATGDLIFGTGNAYGATERVRITTAGILYVKNDGVDNNYQPMIGGMYNANNNETNLISTAVSSVAAQSGFRFDVSNGAGSAARTTSMTINRSSVSIVGSLSKGSGSFRICHPLSSKVNTHALVHSFIEGPNADLIYSGHTKLTNGIACINIDCSARMTQGTFEALNRCVRIFTTNETSWDAVRGKVCGNMVVIESQNNTSEDEISWMVIGERQDQHMFDTEWTDNEGRVITEPELTIVNDDDII